MYGNSAETVLWTVSDVAAFLRVSKGTVYRRVEDGKLPHVRVLGTLIRFDPAQIRAMFVAPPEG